MGRCVVQISKRRGKLSGLEDAESLAPAIFNRLHRGEQCREEVGEFDPEKSLIDCQSTVLVKPCPARPLDRSYALSAALIRRTQSITPPIQ